MTLTLSQIVTFVIALVGLILTVLNIIDKVIVFRKNANEPLKQLEARVAALEAKSKEHDQRLLNGNEHFHELDKALEVINKSTLALIDFEIQYCITEHKEISGGLSDAQKELRAFLSKR